MDWIKLMHQSFKDFMKEEGIDSGNIKDRLNEDTLKKFLERFAGSADPDELRKKLADAPGAVGFFTSLVLAMPIEGRLVTILGLSEISKAAGLPIPFPVRDAAILALAAYNGTGVTDADVRRYRSRVLSTFTTRAPAKPTQGAVIMPGPNMFAFDSAPIGVWASPAMVSEGFDNFALSTSGAPKNGIPDPTPPGSGPVIPPNNSPDPVPGKPGPDGGKKEGKADLTPSRMGVFKDVWCYWDLLDKQILPLRYQEILTVPHRQSEYQFGMNWVKNHLSEDSEHGVEAREAFNRLPPLTEAERDALEPHLKVLRRAHATKNAATPAERAIAAEQVEKVLAESSDWEMQIRLLARAYADWFRKSFQFGLMSVIDDAVTDANRETIYTTVGTGALALVAMVGYAIHNRANKIEQTKEPEKVTTSDTTTPSGTPPVPPTPPTPPADPADATKAPAKTEPVKSEKKEEKPPSPPQKAGGEPFGCAAFVGWSAIIGLLIMGIPVIATWFIDGMSLRAVIVNIVVVGIWCAKYLAFKESPWVWLRDHEVISDNTNERLEKKLDKKSKIFQAVAERDYKLLLMTPGLYRRLTLKIALGATLIGGIIMNLIFIGTGDSHAAQSLVAIGIETIGLYLDLAMLFATIFSIEEVQDMLKKVFKPAFHAIGGLLLAGIGINLLFPGIFQVGLLNRVQSTTTGYTPVTKAMVKANYFTTPLGDLWMLHETKTAFAPEPLPPVIPPLTGREVCVREREEMEAVNPGICERNSGLATCLCK